MKIQSKGWENMFAKHLSDKGFIMRIHKIL